MEAGNGRKRCCETSPRAAAAVEDERGDESRAERGHVSGQTEGEA